jgi:hypothetical protein
MYRGNLASIDTREIDTFVLHDSDINTSLVNIDANNVVRWFIFDILLERDKCRDGLIIIHLDRDFSIHFSSHSVIIRAWNKWNEYLASWRRDEHDVITFEITKIGFQLHRFLFIHGIWKSPFFLEAPRGP